MTRARTIRRIIAALALASATGCVEERVVDVRGGLTGIPGAQGQVVQQREKAGKPSGDKSSTPGSYASMQARTRAAAEQEGEFDPATLRVTREDGTVTIVSTAPRHVITHLRRLIGEENRELLYEQLLSDRAKEAYRTEGLDPHEAVEFIFANRRDVLKLLARMPLGESTPGLFMRRIGPSAYRLEAPSKGDLNFTRLDIVWEGGMCRLLLIS